MFDNADLYTDYVSDIEDKIKSIMEQVKNIGNLLGDKLHK